MPSAMRSVALLFVVASIGCGSSPPPDVSTPLGPSASSGSPNATPPASSSPPVTSAPPASSEAPSEKAAPEPTAPQIEVVDHHEPPFLDLPGPSCESALHEPMPGKDREVPLRAKIGAIQMNGRANHADVARAVQKDARSGLTKCADLAKTRLDQPVGVKVSYDGTTPPTVSDGSGKTGDPLAACIVQALSGVHYPKPEGGTVTMVIAISYTKTEFVPADKAKLEAWAKRINVPCKSKK
jgi:hypothetical protein